MSARYVCVCVARTGRRAKRDRSEKKKKKKKKAIERLLSIVSVLQEASVMFDVYKWTVDLEEIACESERRREELHWLLYLSI